MDKKEVIELLKKYLEEYNYIGFVFHKKFIEELKGLFIKEKGHESEIFALMIKQLVFVKEKGKLVNQIDSNEKLRDTGLKDYYSLHIQNKTVNIRLLMTFTEQEMPIFLAAFFERKGKQKTNYSTWIPVIQDRYQMLIGDNSNG